MIIALTREPARSMEACELTHMGREPIDAGAAARQHRGYREALAACGARVVTLPAVDELPDSVFVEDTAVVLEEVAVLTRPGVVSRRGEVRLVEPEVARLRPVARIEPPATLEGGDVLRLGRTLYVGLSPRTNAEGAAALRRLVAPHGYEVVTVEPRGCLHLKTGCSALDDETVLVNPEWVNPAFFRGREVVAADASEPWAGNVLSVGGVVCASAASPRTAGALAARGYDVRAVDVSEFSKAEGSMTCLSLLFLQP